MQAHCPRLTALKNGIAQCDQVLQGLKSDLRALMNEREVSEKEKETAHMTGDYTAVYTLRSHLRADSNLPSRSASVTTVRFETNMLYKQPL